MKYGTVVEFIVLFIWSGFDTLFQMAMKLLNSVQQNSQTKFDVTHWVRVHCKVWKRSLWILQWKLLSQQPILASRVLRVNVKNAKSKSSWSCTVNNSNFILILFRCVNHRYEETYFTRLPFTRQERHSNRQQYSAKSLASELAGMGTLPETKRKSQGGKKKGTQLFLLINKCLVCLNVKFCLI